MLADKRVIASAAVLCNILAPLAYFSDYLQGDVQLNLVNDKIQVSLLHIYVHVFMFVFVLLMLLSFSVYQINIGPVFGYVISL